jgi:hypothetical protein
VTYPHNIAIPKDGAIYNDRCRWQDIAFGQKVQVAGDESIDADGYVFFPSAITGIVPDLTFRLTLESEVQEGEIVHVERVGGLRMAVGRLLDTAESTTLGTIDDLDVLDNGVGSVALTFSAVDSATSYQAQVDGEDEGDSTSETIIVLTGLSSEEHDFTVIATDGTSETTSNEVTHEVT